MLFKLVLTFIAAAHCLPTGYKHAESAERLHALEKKLDALKHVAEQMERRGSAYDDLMAIVPCDKECEAAFGKPDLFFHKWVEEKYGRCNSRWNKVEESTTPIAGTR